MRRCLTVLAMLLTLLMGTLTTVAAQNGTPVPGGASGEGITVFGADGQPEATVTVNSIADPFKEFDPSTPPQRGFHFVAADVTISAAEGKDIEPNSYGFELVDTDGFVSTVTFVYRSEDATAANPDLPTDAISGGQSASGLIFFQVLDNTEPALVIYQPDYSRYVTVADLRDSQVQQGDSVDIVDTSGKPAQTVSVDDVIVPLKDFDPSSPPQRGFQYGAIQVTIKNTGTQPLDVQPYNFSLVDEQGFVDNSTTIYRTSDAEASSPSLQSATLDAGQSVSGLVGFQMLTGTQPALIVYAPDGNIGSQQVRLAEFGEQVAKPSGTPKPATTRTATKTPVVDEETPTPEGTVGANVTTPGCEGVVEWATASIENLTGWTEIFSDIEPVFTGGTVDADLVRQDAQKASDLADKQSKIDTPDVAQDAQTAAVNLFDDTATALNNLADAIDANDQAAIKQAVQDITDVANVISSDDPSNPFNALGDKCPELSNLGG